MRVFRAGAKNPWVNLYLSFRTGWKGQIFNGLFETKIQNPFGLFG